MIWVRWSFLVLTICVLDFVKTSEEEYQSKIFVKDEEESYERAVKTLKNYFSHEVIQSNLDNYSQEKSPRNHEEKFHDISQKSQTSRELDSNATISKRTLEPIQKEPRNKEAEDLGTNHQRTKRYLNEWAIRMSGGEESARRIVKELGYTFHGSVKGFEDVYRVSHQLQHHNDKRETEEITRHINSHIEVLWAEQQISRPRDKRSAISQDKRSPKKDKQDNIKSKIKESKEKGKDKSKEKGKDKSKTSLQWIDYMRTQEQMFNDPLWKHQWYLFDSRTREDLPELDLRVIPVWDSGITGKGINVVIIDDGLEWNHTDLIKNYNPNISYDINDDDFDPTPRYDQSRTNAHGTKCAGEIVMQPNNQKCGVGVAYNALIGGIRMLDGEVTDRVEGAALAIGQDLVDVMSCSWGPTDDGTTLEGPGTLAEVALEKGVKEGRKGKGIIFVWAAGNGGTYGDNCNCDGYVSSIYTVSVSTASENGESPWYSEHCASTLTSTYSSGAYSDQKIVTTDIGNDCTVSFSGTSASAPLAAGIIALALEANPSMTWRDVQHAVVRASNWTLLSRDNGWKTNGVGLHFNIKFGFGLLMAKPLVDAARNWTSVPEKRICTTDGDIGSEVTIASGGKYGIEITPSCNASTEIKYLEHVQIVLSMSHSNRGTLTASLTSPQGTTTIVMATRSSDKSTNGFSDWPLTSVHTWGENPAGVWKFSIEDTSVSNETGTIQSVSIILHGTKEPIL